MTISCYTIVGTQSVRISFEKHTLEEYHKKYGKAYKRGDLWDFAEEDIASGAIEVNPEMTYWPIKVKGKIRYFETDE